MSNMLDIFVECDNLESIYVPQVVLDRNHGFAMAYNNIIKTVSLDDIIKECIELVHFNIVCNNR